jgi:hypothetical protein
MLLYFVRYVPTTLFHRYLGQTSFVFFCFLRVIFIFNTRYAHIRYVCNFRRVNRQAKVDSQRYEFRGIGQKSVLVITKKIVGINM